MTEIKIQDFEAYGNWINNQDEIAGNVESINVISPYFDKKIASIPASNSEHLDSAVEAASAAFLNWSRTNIRDRAQIMSRFKSIIENDIENFSFNTPVSCFMIAVNELTAQKCSSKEILESLLILLSPYVPHICEELWEMLGNNNSITFESFPIFDPNMLIESTKIYPISINGKVKLKLEISLALNNEEIENIILANAEVISKLEGKSPKRVIFIPGKIINLVV